jgi:hypothetical protein
MENKKHTALEWLNQMLVSKGIFFEYELYQQAKAMEKEQHKETYSIGWTTRERFDDLVPDIIYPEGLDYEEKQEYAFEKYYNEHYGK